MRVFRVLTESPKVGRAFQHLEDLVLVNGSAGAYQALARLNDIGSGAGQVRWKWDGKPQVYWGRDDAGRFLMTGHNGWLKADKSGKTYSATQLSSFIMNTGKATTDQEVAARQAFATEFSSLWPLFEAATPENFRGYVYGDLLYMRRPQVQKNMYNFTPNKVTYHVKTNSDLGKRIARSQAAVVGHAYFTDFGQPDSEQQPIDDFDMFNQNAGLIVLGPRYAASTPVTDQAKIKHITDYVKSYQKQMDALLDDSKLASQKMTGFKQVLYNFNNQMAKAGRLNNAAHNFMEWLPNSKQSVPMQKKITDWVSKNQQGFTSLFATMEQIRAVKNQIIDHIDQEEGDITASTGGQAGGEGYVMYNPEGNVKLVPRHRWQPG
jgi:Family of unknown function (DUF6267)